MSVLAPVGSIKQDRQIERGQTEWKGWPQNSFFCLLETWYAIKIVLNLNSNRWIFTVYQLVLCKWDTLFLSDTRLYECFSWLICFVSTFQFQFGEKQTDIYGWILHTTVCVIEMFCELIGEICNSAPGQFAGPCCVRRRRAWHRVWPPHQTSHSMSGSFQTFGMIFWNNSSASFCPNM